MKEHNWPGNLRELRNVIHRAALLAIGKTIRPEHLLLQPISPAPSPEREQVALVPLAEIEKQHILAVCAACEDDKAQAAQVLAISRSTLDRRLRKYQAAESV